MGKRTIMLWEDTTWPLKIRGISSSHCLNHEWQTVGNNYVEVEKIAQSVANLFKDNKGYSLWEDLQNAVPRLSEVLCNRFQDHTEEFEKAHSDHSNFRQWSAYMDMIQILLDFIRAMRDDSWNLHVDVFLAMLLWLTIYDHKNYARWGPVYRWLDLTWDDSTRSICWIHEREFCSEQNKKALQPCFSRSGHWVGEQNLQTAERHYRCQKERPSQRQVLYCIVRMITHITGHRISF